MLFQTYDAIQDAIEYHKNDDGTWRAEFHGVIDVSAQGPTLERCRWKMRDAVDSALAVWVTRRQNPHQPGGPEIAETETPASTRGQ